jgi:hypothetical protein
VVRQPQRKVGPEDDKRQNDKHGEVKRNGAEYYLAQFTFPDALDNEEVNTDRRRNLSKLDKQHKHDAEQDWIDTVALQHRKD